MSLIDFFGRQRLAPPAKIQPANPPPSVPEPSRVTPEDLIEDSRWTFAPSITSTAEKRMFSTETIQNATAIYTAQQMRRIADDIETIRKHLTRLRLIEDDPPATLDP